MMLPQHVADPRYISVVDNNTIWIRAGRPLPHPRGRADLYVRAGRPSIAFISQEGPPAGNQQSLSPK